MKLHNYLIISFLILISLSLNAQKNTFEAGVAVGFNMSQIDGDLLFGFRRIGVAAGPVVNINTATRWQVGIGMMYSQLGSARGKFDEPTSDFDKIRINQVEVPITLRFKDWKGEDDKGEFFRIGFEVGVTYNRMINQTFIARSGEDITDDFDFEPNGVSLQFGATYYINSDWGVHSHWAKQLTSLTKSTSQPMVNRYINLGLIYLL